MKNLFNVAASLILLLLAAGCETESSDQIAISISPNNVTMTKGESREFTASGWRDYTWSLSDTSIGILSTTKGDSTIYTAVAGASSTNSGSTQILTVTVNLAAGAPGTVTNQPSNLVSAQAFIIVDAVVSGDISISPPVATIQRGESVVLNASGPGGVTDYVWQLEAPVHGALSILGGSSTIYTATNGPATSAEPPLTQIVRLSSNGGRNTTTAAITIRAYTP